MNTDMQTQTENATAVVKITRDKSGKFVRAEKQVVNKERKGLKLTCQITGKSRPTNQKYLDAKAGRLGVSVAELIANYVSKEGLEQITKDTPNYDTLMRVNGKVRSSANKQTPDMAVAS